MTSAVPNGNHGDPLSHYAAGPMLNGDGGVFDGKCETFVSSGDADFKNATNGRDTCNNASRFERVDTAYGQRSLVQR